MHRKDQSGLAYQNIGENALSQFSHFNLYTKDLSTLMNAFLGHFAPRACRQGHQLCSVFKRSQRRQAVLYTDGVMLIMMVTPWAAGPVYCDMYLTTLG